MPGTPIDCEEPHTYEYYEGACTVDGLISWLGGSDDIDVARGRVSSSPSGCLVDFRIPVVGSSSQALEREDGDGLRRCSNAAANEIVSCSQPHDGEFVAAGVGGIAKRQDCESAADTYLGVAIDSRSDELRVRRITTAPEGGDNARCVIEVVGDERLAESVRDVGNAQLHWVS